MEHVVVNLPSHFHIISKIMMIVVVQFYYMWWIILDDDNDDKEHFGTRWHILVKLD